MKPTTLLLIATLATTGCAISPKRFTAPSTADVHQGIKDVQSDISSAKSDAVEAKKSIAKARVLGKDNKSLVLALDSANGRIDNLTKSLLNANVKAGEADKKLTEKDVQMSKIVDSANKTNAKAFVAIKRYHTLKFYVCSIAAAFVGLLVWQFKSILLVIPPPYGIAVGVAAPVLAFTALWFML